MPLQRRLPKRGFRREKRHPFQIVNLIAVIAKADGRVVNPEWLHEKGLIHTLNLPVKILADGDVTAQLTVKASAFSEAARAKIEAAGGTAEVI